MADARAAAAESAASAAGDGGAAEGKRARDEGDEGEAAASSTSSSSSSSPSSSSRAARASRRATGAPVQRPPRARRRTAAERARLADLFLDEIGVVMAYNRGQFAHECWQVKDLCRETRYIAGVTQPGSLADMVFHGCRLGGVTKLLEEARKCKRVDYVGSKGTTQLLRAAEDNDIERVRQLLRLGCPAAVVNAQDAEGWTALCWASYRGHEAVVRELLAHGVDINTQSNSSWTRLMWASHRGHLAVVRLLCDVPGIDVVARGGYLMKRTVPGWPCTANASRSRPARARVALPKDFSLEAPFKQNHSSPRPALSSGAPPWRRGP